MGRDDGHNKKVAKKRIVSGHHSRGTQEEGGHRVEPNPPKGGGPSHSKSTEERHNDLNVLCPFVYTCGCRGVGCTKITSGGSMGYYAPHRWTRLKAWPEQTKRNDKATGSSATHPKQSSKRASAKRKHSRQQRATPTAHAVPRCDPEHPRGHALASRALNLPTGQATGPSACLRRALGHQSNVRLQGKKTGARILHWQTPCSPRPSPSPSTCGGQAGEKKKGVNNGRDRTAEDTRPQASGPSYHHSHSSWLLNTQDQATGRGGSCTPPNNPSSVAQAHEKKKAGALTPFTRPQMIEPRPHMRKKKKRKKTYRSSRSVADTDMPGTGGSALSHSSSSFPSRRRATGDSALAAGSAAPRGGPLPPLLLMAAAGGGRGAGGASPSRRRDCRGGRGEGEMRAPLPTTQPARRGVSSPPTGNQAIAGTKKARPRSGQLPYRGLPKRTRPRPPRHRR